MKALLSMAAFLGVLAYSAFSLLWQYTFVWIAIPFLLIAALVMIHTSAQRPRVDARAVIGIVLAPLFLSIGMIARVGPGGIPLILVMYLLPGLALFAGYYAALRWERAEISPRA
jgi:hypothetical protein